MGSSLGVRNEKVWARNLAGITHTFRTWSGTKDELRLYALPYCASNPEYNPYHVGGAGLSTPTSAMTLMDFSHAMVVIGNLSGALSNGYLPEVRKSSRFVFQ